VSATATDPLIDADLVDAPYDAFARLREDDPVHRVEGTDVFAVCRLDLIHEVVADTATFSSRTDEFLHVLPDGTAELRSASGSTAEADSAIAILAIADPPDHGRQRRILTPVLSNQAVALREADLRALVDRTLAPHLAAGSIDWMASVAEPLPMVMLARLLGAGDDDAEFLQRFGYMAVELTNGLTSDERIEEILHTLFDLGPIGDLYNEARAGGGPGPETIIGACAAAVGTGDMDDIEALGIIMMMAAAGGESTASLLGSGARILAQDRELQQRLRDDPRLIPAFVEEACRLEPPFRGHYRRVLTDAVLGGVEVPAGSRLLLLWPAANRDRAIGDDADEVDVTRAAPRQHVGFGWGIHLCIGAPLARLEAKVAFERLLASTSSFEVADPEPLRHHRSLMVRRLVTLPLTLHPR
jgi:cytochrome P450